ncbi:glycosyltransferase family 4 protein [Halorubrum ezzemoulense]|uniref:glycosyltransferase family 4 protein n=1 Tax=Halorubrum ezzemoulense TaxID=337243 RepID=UPI00232D8BF3|nr:glycosyltransferase family 4 protein [Halorubrum ezzemoulense]MDB2282663.1 glycosyltransferase family 4 protein [Halorubrum ezzemoulense]
MLYHGNNEDLHPAHRGFAEAINADLLSVSNTSPHSKKSFYQEFSRGYSIGDYNTVIAEGSRPLYTGVIHKMLHGSNLVYLCADHRLYDLWNTSVEVHSAYSLMKYALGTYGKPGVRSIAQHGVDGIVAISEFVKDYLYPIFQDHVPVTIAHPYIQPELYKKLGRVDPDLDQKTAVTVGRSTRYKGVDLLVDAWPSIREEHPEAELHIVGEGHPKSYADTAGVTVRGFVDDLVDVYENAGLYVQPSRIEPFGVAVLEGLRAGLPAVITESTGARSEVTELDEQLITPATPEGLSKGISWYFSRSQDEKEELSAKAKIHGGQFGPEAKKQVFREKFRELQKKIDLA